VTAGHAIHGASTSPTWDGVAVFLQLTSAVQPEVTAKHCLVQSVSPCVCLRGWTKTYTSSQGQAPGRVVRFARHSPPITTSGHRGRQTLLPGNFEGRHTSFER